MGSGSTRRALIGSFAALAFAVGTAQAGCREDQVELRWPGGQARFAVEVADTDATRSRGLMFRETLPRSAGMLFVYDSPRRATFWMKNTLIPLDMIFADASGRVTRVHANAKPQDLTTIDGGAGVKLVLEINGGLAARLGIAPGAELRHPAIADPAWSCAE
ncbi:MAG: DUF192 domain-containing protein [Paracoccaceae bacterium]